MERVGRCDVSEEFDVLKGPPVAGRFEKATWNITPLPSGIDTAWTEPLTLPLGNAVLSKAVSGSVAMYWAPLGLSVTAIALPRLCDPALGTEQSPCKRYKRGGGGENLHLL